MMESAPFETGQPGIRPRWSTISKGHGLSEFDIMNRQRYFENSRNPETVQNVVSRVSNPGIPPSDCSSQALHSFLREQQKMVSEFRAQPWPMQMKIAAVKSHRVNINKHTSRLNMMDYCRSCMKRVMKKISRRLQLLVEVLTLWRSIIKHIEGQSGTSVASFFVFLRWLCALNCFLALFILFLIILPQSILGHGLEVPASVRENGTSLLFILDGKGYLMEYSVLFYGYYDSGQNEPYRPPPPNPEPFISSIRYRLPLAYALVIISIFVFYCIAILTKMAIKYRTLQKATVGERFPFAWLVFNSWDFAITKPATATSKMLDITISLKETLAEADVSVEKKINVWMVIVRVFTNTLILVMLGTTSYAIYLAVDSAESHSQNGDFHNAFNSGLTKGIVLLLTTFQVQGVVTIRNLLLPYVFELAEWVEKFHPRTALKLRLVRLFLLYLSSLYVLIISLFTISSHCGGEMVGDSPSCCWETSIGQELFKLNLTHMMADMATMSVQVARWLVPKIPVVRKLEKMVGPTEFRIADSVLTVIYGQALILLGVLFCPLLPLIGFIKYIIIFYCRAVVVYYCNQPPHNIFRVSSTLNFYLGILLATILLCSFPVGYALIRMSPSVSCGPFRGLDNMLQVLLEEIERWPLFLQVAIDNLRTATVIVPILALLGLQIYYYAVMSSALKEVNKDLKLQLRMEHADIREKMAMFRHAPLLDPQHQTNRHLLLHRALHSHQHTSTPAQSYPNNPMMAPADTPHHHHYHRVTSRPHNSPPSHPHSNGLLEHNHTPVIKPPPVLSSSHTHH